MPANYNDTTPAAPAGRVNVHWQTDGSGHISANVSPGSRTVVSKSIAYNAVAGDIVLVDSTAGDVTITLPAATATQVVDVKKTVAAHNVIVAAPAGKTIEGASTLTMTNAGDDATCAPDGVNNWILI